MINVLVTGKSGYIANEFIKYMQAFSQDFNITALSLRDNDWEHTDFSKFDCVLHLAGLAHKKEDSQNANMYYEINHRLTERLAKKAKESGVSQFILASTLSVYGKDSGQITSSTQLLPTTHYGKSKLLAEQSLQDSMKNCIVRIPMVYGRGCGGNYAKLSGFAKTTPFFPKVNNKRSMIYIEHLCEFFRLLIKNNDSGLFHPQNKELICTTDLVTEIAEAHGTKLTTINIAGTFLKLLMPFSKTLRKIFGDLVVSSKLSFYKEDYCLYNLQETIIRTEAMQ